MALLANIKQLFVPHKANGNGKDPVTFRDYGDDMRVIETWAKQLVASLGAGITHITSADGTVTITNPFGPTTDLHVATGGGSAYASLQGPGQTTTPGNLTQLGGFTVDASSTNVLHLYTGVSNLNMTDLGGQAAHLQHNEEVWIESGNGAAGTSSYVSITGNSPLGATVQIHNSGAGSKNLCFFGHNFFGGIGGASQQAVTGSRGGNAALASLLTALNAYGLIIDSSSP